MDESPKSGCAKPAWEQASAPSSRSSRRDVTSPVFGRGPVTEAMEGARFRRTEFANGECGGTWWTEGVEDTSWMTPRQALLMRRPEAAYWLMSAVIEAKVMYGADKDLKSFVRLLEEYKVSPEPQGLSVDPAATAYLASFSDAVLQFASDAATLGSSASMSRRWFSLPQDLRAALRFAGRAFSMPGDMVVSCSWYSGSYTILVKLRSGRALHLRNDDSAFAATHSELVALQARNGLLLVPHRDCTYSADELKRIPGTIELSGQVIWPQWQETAAPVEI